MLVSGLPLRDIAAQVARRCNVSVSVTGLCRHQQRCLPEALACASTDSQRDIFRPIARALAGALRAETQLGKPDWPVRLKAVSILMRVFQA
jgi:hypothetical protein